ncbi:MAG: DUF1275 domain-containing protein, partial [Clostridiales bacterium]|nr:DUF1275 domain-containing protein [Clostridiales bacterium]
TYICRGGVFANAETGNIVLMGIKFANKEFSHALKYLIPIFCFAAGVLVAQTVRKFFKNSKAIHWRQISILFEIIVLFVIAFVPSEKSSNVFTNALVSFVCSIQVQSFRQINGNAIATTMCTGNLRSGTEHLFKYFTEKNKTEIISSFHYFGIILFFIAGASIGAAVTDLLWEKAVLFPCAALVIVFALMFIYRKEKEVIEYE